jgi:hypothetical protein
VELSAVLNADPGHDILLIDSLIREKSNGTARSFAKQGSKYVQATDLLFPARLNVKHGSLQDPLKSNRRLNIL